LIGASAKIAEGFNGKVPETMEHLLQLPGVARKTANVVLGTAFGVASGIVVDTHVGRVAKRLALTCQSNPVEIEKELMEKVSRKDWISFSHRLIFHGRQICKARRPRCEECFLTDLCPFPKTG
jgi:endonuclease-3